MDDFVNYSNEETTLYKYCYDISGKFMSVTPGEILYMPGHVGLYVGNVEIDGKLYNVAECCYSSFGGGGRLTWVDADGTRRRFKNGDTAGAWTQHGKCYRVDYDINNEPLPEITPAQILTAVNETFAGRHCFCIEYC